MNTPISDFVESYRQKSALRLHMPGHKGNGSLGVERLDITEIAGADSLYEAAGIIHESERNASALFGTKATFYSTEGSSQCIRAMIWLVRLYAAQNGMRPVIAACRNAHKTFVTACAVLGVEANYLRPKEGASYLSCPLNACDLRKYLISCEKLPVAVYITSPDYLGNIADVESLARICHEHGVLLLCDNAHGAYLRFLTPRQHPMDLGVDLCCDSAHKTLPVLTGGAYLHVAQNAPDFFVDNAKNALSLFGSTSPSYLILQSLDLANRYLAEGYGKKLNGFVCQLDALKERLRAKGFVLMGNEPLKLTLSARDYGYRGDEIAEHLRARGIEIEFADPDVAVMMFTPETGIEGILRTENALISLEKKEKSKSEPIRFVPSERMLSAFDAITAPFVTIPADKALGRVLASPTVGCPPAVPIVMCGERIDRNAIELLGYYGIQEVNVIKEADSK